MIFLFGFQNGSKESSKLFSLLHLILFQSCRTANLRFATQNDPAYCGVRRQWARRVLRRWRLQMRRWQRWLSKIVTTKLRTSDTTRYKSNQIKYIYFDPKCVHNNNTGFMQYSYSYGFAIIRFYVKMAIWQCYDFL